VHVGDHPLNDVVGAKQAGLRAIWLRRDLKAECTVAPDLSIDSLDETLAALVDIDAPRPR
jgi:putative hydrolase of the HAD superfamily